MAYSKEIFLAAKNKFEERKKTIKISQEKKLEQFFKHNPQALEIEKELARTAIATAKTIFNNNNNPKRELEELKQKNMQLQKKLNNILEKNNLSAEFLEPKNFCNICRDEGYKNGKICECFKKLLKQEAYERLNKLSPLSLSTFESFDLKYYPSNLGPNGTSSFIQMSKIFDLCKNYANKFDKISTNLLMWGATGLGKTHLSLAIANQVLKQGFDVIYISVPNIISQLEKERFKSHNNQSSENYLTSCDLLILDDLGTEFQTSFSNATIYNIINSRLMYSKPTIISTNLSIKEIEKSYSDRLISRIMGNFRSLYFFGEDIRQKKFAGT